MMSKIKSFNELKSVQERLKAGRDPKKPCITMCVGTGCLAYGTQKLVDSLREELAKRNLTDKIDFRTSGCHGFCERGPMVVIGPEKIFYQRVGLGRRRRDHRQDGPEGGDHRPAPLRRSRHGREGRPRGRRALLQEADPPRLRPEQQDRSGEASKITWPSAATARWGRPSPR